MDQPKVIWKAQFIDDRGYVYGAFDNMDKFDIKRTYVISNWSKGMIRALHGHRKADTYLHVIKGAAKLAAIKMEYPHDVMVETLSDKKPGLFYIPKNYYNGSMSLKDNTIILAYSTITLEECKNDDHRMSWKNLHPEIWEVEHR